ncbi:MAG: RNA polymerase sigma factor [Opitutales bacterium]
MEEDESVLAQRAATGEADAFEELVRRHRPKLLRFLAAYLGNYSDAEDLVQDTFARAYAALDRYDPNQSFTTWLFVIGRRLAANEKRRLGRQRTREAELAAEKELEKTNLDFDGGTVWAAAQSILTETSYATIWLHYGEGQPVKDIARILGKSVTGVKVTLFRARRTLARELDPKLVAESIDR